jgi:hypothetical protein
MRPSGRLARYSAEVRRISVTEDKPMPDREVEESLQPDGSIVVAEETPDLKRLESEDNSGTPSGFSAGQP